MDLKKVIRQHIDMDNFFSGGFTVKTAGISRQNNEPAEAGPADGNVAAELEEIADEVRKCRKCDLGSLRANAVPGEGNSNAKIVFVGEGPVLMKMHRVCRLSAEQASCSTE